MGDCMFFRKNVVNIFLKKVLVFHFILLIFIKINVMNELCSSEKSKPLKKPLTII